MTRYKFCLWGGNDHWIQVGSPTDRRIQIHLRFVANVQRLTGVFSRALLPAAQRATDALKGLAQAFESSRSWS